MISEQGDTEARLTADQLKTLRQRLERLEAELLARLGVEQSVALEGERFTEPMDAAEQTREQEDAVLFTNRDRALLEEVRHALAKFETGRYGLSEISGSPIELRRLEAIPWARTDAEEA
jgi:RNA polymerase-binding transcription factor DksA